MNLASIIDQPPDDAPALLTDAGSIDYATLRGAVSAARDGLLARGLGPDDRLVIVDTNTEHFIVAHLAALAAGLVSVPLDPACPPAELARSLAQIEPAAIVAGAVGSDAIESLATRYSAMVLDATDLCAEASAHDRVDPVERDVDDLAVLLFTSGTAGSPRAAALTHGNLMANLEQLQRHPGRAASPSDRTYGVVPFSHVFGLSSVLHLTVFAGGSIHLVEQFRPREALAAIRDHALTVVVGPPPMWAALAAVDDAAPSDMVSVRLAVSGASALAPEVHQNVLRRLGLDLREGYGLTEASPAVAMSAGTEAPPGSVGVPLPGVEVRLVADGADVLIGDPGEVWVRGPNVFAGYLDDDEATAAVIDDEGWLHTGDIAVVDDDGYLSIVDRAKDLIIVSGFNVFPAEVEDALRRHPQIRDAAVVGVPSERSGEGVAAWVVLEDGAVLDEDAVLAHSASQLARYKCPTVVHVVDELAVRPDGKLARRRLG